MQTATKVTGITPTTTHFVPADEFWAIVGGSQRAIWGGGGYEVGQVLTIKSEDSDCDGVVEMRISHIRPSDGVIPFLISIAPNPDLNIVLLDKMRVILDMPDSSLRGEIVGRVKALKAQAEVNEADREFADLAQEHLNAIHRAIGVSTHAGLDEVLTVIAALKADSRDTIIRSQAQLLTECAAALDSVIQIAYATQMEGTIEERIRQGIHSLRLVTEDYAVMQAAEGRLLEAIDASPEAEGYRGYTWDRVRFRLAAMEVQTRAAEADTQEAKVILGAVLLMLERGGRSGRATAIEVIKQINLGGGDCEN
jgi:hypothetical protein